MPMGIGRWLRQQREARGWARREMAHRLTQAAEAVGDTTVPGIDHLCTYIRRWEVGRHGPTERYKLFYCTAFGITPQEYGTAPPPPPRPEPEGRGPVRASGPSPARSLPGTALTAAQLADPRLAVSIALACHELNQGQAPDERDVLMTAHEGTDHAGRYHTISPAAVEQLRADVARLAGLCDTGEPSAVYKDLRRVRDRMGRLAERRLWPREQTSLHVLLGCVNGLLGMIVLRLGHPDAAAELARTGQAYADALGHRPL